MKAAGLVLLLAACAGAAQIAARPASADQTRLSLDVIRTLERVFDNGLESVRPEPINVVGATRGLYLPGYGLVFTAELDLTLTPVSGGMMLRQITPAERAAIHDKKLAQLPVLEQLMRGMVTASARAADTLPDHERIVLAVRLWYQAFEDQNGLPREILLSTDRKSALSGQKLEVSSK